jgi:hypothetical protein
MYIDLSTMHRVDLSTPAPESRAASLTIERAMYEQNGVMVRCFLSDQIQSVCADNDQTALGRQLQAWKKQGHTIEPYSPPPITPYEVDIERDRRNHLGEELFLKSGKVVYMATATGEDYDNINYASDTALTLIAKTDPGLADAIRDIANDIDPKVPVGPTMTFRDFYRRPTTVTYHEMSEIKVRVTDNVNIFNQAAHVLKDMNPIPRDYKNDKYWPNIPRPPLNPPPL